MTSEACEVGPGAAGAATGAAGVPAPRGVPAAPADACEIPHASGAATAPGSGEIPQTSAPAPAAACELPGQGAAGRTWQGPGATERLAILRRTRSIAIVGASANPARASYFVSTYLLSSTPYDLYFVNPRAGEILGRPAYASLQELPVAPDLVDVFRKHDDLPGVAREAIDAGAKTLWLQLGSWHEEAARIAEEAGLSVVMDRCIKVEHARFHGGLRLAGFNTGVISSRRQLSAR